MGASVNGLNVGQRAWANSLGFAGRPGATAERVAVDAERTYPLPPGVDPDTAAAVLHPCTTAALAVDRQGNLQPGERVYIVGGAATVLDYRDPELVTRLQKAAPEGIDVQIDTAGHNDVEAAVEPAALRGRIGLLARPTTQAVLPVGQLYMRDVRLRGFAISNTTVAELADAAETVITLLATEAWTPRHTSRGSFNDAGWAQARLESGQARGTRIVLQPAP